MSSFETLRATFAALVPDFTRMAKAAFRDLDPEARAEAVQNTLALAWHAFHALIEKGRGDEPGIIKSVLWFSIKQTRAGRRLPSGGETKPKDCFSYAKKGRVKFEKVDLWHFVSEETPVPEAVSFRVDVPDFFNTLSDRQRSIAEELMAGTTTKECAEKFGVTASAISQFRASFKNRFETFMDE
jgi:hypothetical protein